jgi:hypothetical protein
MAEKDEQHFADAADALAAPLEGDEPAEGDVFHDSEEELEDEAMEEEEAAEDPHKPLSREQCFNAKDLETFALAAAARLPLKAELKAECYHRGNIRCA